MQAITQKTVVSFRTMARATRTAGPARRVVMPVRAFRDEEAGNDTAAQVSTAVEETAAKIQAAWEASEEKPTIIAVGTLGLLALYFTNSIVSAVDRLPLISTVFELIGLFYSGYVAYKFFLVEGEKEALTDSVKSFVSKVGIKL